MLRQLGKHHFAHLRAVAEGLDVGESARRYLGIAHGAEVESAHRAVVDQVRAVARRRGDPCWRLIGLQISDVAPASVGALPPLDEWAEAEGLSGWSHAELLEMHAERFGHQVDPRSTRRVARNQRLRERRLELLKMLERAAAESALPTDAIDGWFAPDVAQRMKAAGWINLADLQRAVARGGRWWSVLPTIGPAKAARLAEHLAQLLGPTTASAGFALAPLANRHTLAGATGANRPAGIVGVGTSAQDDQAAVQAWLHARASSPATKRMYAREAERFLLYCVMERGKAMSDANADDCQAYIDFLAKIPERWISRRKTTRMAAGWAPFRGQLSLKSRKAALDALNSLFGWLVQARYLVANPWVLVSRKLGDDPLADGDPTSRAFTPAAWAALKECLQERPASPSTARLRWLCDFAEAVGLRSDELIRARRGHLVERGAGWVIKVHGKGSKNRVVPVPARAMQATRAYFRARGLEFDTAAADMPLLASTIDGLAPITYASLYETFKRFVRNALRASALPVDERLHALRASTHWLRHTYATRSAENDVPTDIIQENLGQSDPRTAAKYSRAQLQRRQAAMERVFGVQSD